MKNIHIHSVIVDSKSMEILSADTDFYAYIGRDRFFNSFDKFIHEDCRDRFFSIVEAKDSTPFVIDMVTKSGECIMTYMHVLFEEEKLVIELESVEELREGQELYSKLLSINEDLHGLHNDLIFTYDDNEKIIKMYTSDFRRCTRECTLDEFADEIRGNIKETEYPKLEDLIISLTSESGSFAHTFTGCIITSLGDCKNSIVKGFTTSKMEKATAVGYIHRGSNKGNASYTIEKDALTGTYSKREIANIVRRTIEVEKQPNIAICIIDIDYFKSVNDNFGHMMGDKVLKEVAEIIMTEVGNSGVVGRFGGDEFFVMFYDVDDMEHYREKISSIKNRVRTKYPASEDGSAVSVTLSIGCAVYPMDADNYDDLFSLADFCLYLAKDKGRNRYVIYNKEKHGTLDQIKDYFNNNRRIDNRKELAMGDVICMIADKHYGDESYTPEMLVDDLVENLPIERIICIAGEPLQFRCMSGINLAPEAFINESSNILFNSNIEHMFKNDIWVVDDIEKIKNISEQAYEAFYSMGTKSFVLVRFKDAKGKRAVVSLEMTTARIAWNRNQMFNYRTIARMFAKYEL